MATGGGPGIGWGGGDSSGDGWRAWPTAKKQRAGSGGGGGCGSGTGWEPRMTEKKQRAGRSNTRFPSTYAIIIGSSPADDSPDELPHKPSGGGVRRSASYSLLDASSASSSFSSPATAGFGDSSTADVILHLYIEKPSLFDSSGSEHAPASDISDVHLYLHSDVLRRAKYFDALLSDRWQKDSTRDNVENPQIIYRLNLGVSPSYGSIDHHYSVLKLLYSSDLSGIINNVTKATSLLPVALELLFEDCVKFCVKFLEAVPWTEDEEKKVLSIVPLLREDESQELLARVSPAKNDSSEEMLHGLIMSAIHNHPNMALAKLFVAKLLRDYSSKESARRVLDRAFQTSLKVVKDSMEQYSSPDFRGDHNETEAIQRLNLHTAMTSGRHLLWLIERMIELRVADNAVIEWSNQSSLTSDLQRAFRDDAWRNIVPGFPSLILRCTFKLANAVSTGVVLAARQVRMGLVKDWLPVVIACKDVVTPLVSSTFKSLYPELEQVFLNIISTLPMSDAQELLQQCVSFSTRNVDDCPHLLNAFTTWFRRADQYQ
ncbi:OLC1v1003195C1 [Oldenlandia corymbosa var. corymbosa]|uniref:OLC1v1003195C1 n=1 Tax=Oldenlandia corymbosa var. corymbosa TaxID=529605 RepID=A0AAV1D9N5_OLDCO|nr:OLC1v1003195C1 [Oldenlandia corymbosa var. corymbosa]